MDDNQCDQIGDQAQPDGFENKSGTQDSRGTAQHLLCVDALDAHRSECRGEVDEVDRCDGDYQERHDQQQACLRFVPMRLRGHVFGVVRVINVGEQR